MILPHALPRAVTTALAALAVLMLLPGNAGAAELLDRVFGPERISTAVALSSEFREESEHVLLATAATYPDALAAGPLAGALDAPLLLTHRSDVPDPVFDELDRLGAETVWVLGGYAAVAPEVENALRARGYAVRRLAGGDRYGTAGVVAAETGTSAPGRVVVALGEHEETSRAWADAVTAGALAADDARVPVLLARQDSLPEATEEALEELAAEKVLLLGGPAAIAAPVEERLGELGYTVERVAGETRYETSVALADRVLQRLEEAPHPVVFASGEDFPDALGASALAAALSAPLVLVHPDFLPGDVDAFLRTHTDRWEHGVLVGGPGAASDELVADLDAALRNAPAEQEPAQEESQQAEDDQANHTFEGEASWYGNRFAGRQTACGEPFDPNALTAAHRSLPCGTRLRVTNTANGRQVEVRVNDRGPYSRHRVLDVSRRAADELGFRSAGTAWIRAEVLD